MSQQHQMQMSGIGGPVGGPVGQPANAGTPTASYTPDAIIKKLNTAIYDYLLCQQQYDVARVFSQKMDIETSDVKQSPNQRQNQANGIDSSMDLDSKEHVGIQKRPGDLPAPLALSSEDSPFLQDWWCQFWELYQGNRSRGKPTTLNYVGQQRTQMKGRVNAVNGMDPNGMRQQQYTAMQNGMANNDLRKAAMGNNVNGMTPQQMQAMQKQRQMQQGNAQMPQGGNQMERQGSQMNMSDPRSGSPNTGGGEAPSPKRQRLEGNMQQQQQQQQAMNQARAAQQGQMQNANQSVEAYSAAMQAQMQTAIQRSSSNGNKGMPQNPAMGPGGAQSSPMAQQGIEANAGGEFQYNPRMGMPPQNAGAPAAGQQGQASNGNHALQDYQMQLMLLEQQNKKRLLMARQEQDSMAHPTGVPGPNGGRGSPQPGMMDPNNPQMRGQMVMGADGRPVMRAPSSHPMTGQPMTQQQQMELLRQQQQAQQGMMQNGQMYQHGPQGQPGQMMPGQQPGQAGPPGQPPNMTPRPNNMPPPPAPTNSGQAGTQPSSPAQAPAPPTPNQANKPKPGAKKAANDKKGPAAKKGGADQSENAPPTPTPPPPVTPSNAQAFGNNNKLPMQNGAPGQGPPPNNGQQQQNGGQAQLPDMNSAPFGALDGADQFPMDFANIDSGDVLDNFDFDSFLNNNGDDNGLGFDANFAFGDGRIEADGLN